MKRTSLILIALTLLSLAALPALAESSVGKTTSLHVRGLKGPQPVTGLTVAAVDVADRSVRLQNESGSIDAWFVLGDYTVIRSAADNSRELSLSDLRPGDEVTVRKDLKFFKGKTVYLDVADDS